MIRCDKCNATANDTDAVVWKCNACAKMFKVQKVQVQNFAEKKKQYPAATLLKCKSCGNALDDGKETLFWKCTCGNIAQYKLSDFEEQALVQINGNLIRCPECGKEISSKAKKCVHCGKIFISEKSVTRTCEDCGKTNPINVRECIYCGCPFEEERDGHIVKSLSITKNSKKKVIISIVSVIIIAMVGLVAYNVKVIKPENTYNEAIELLEKGKYEEADILFDTIEGYKDVATIQEQLKYESYAYSAINSLKKYLKNPDSYQPYEIIFYNSMGTKEDSASASEQDIVEEADDEKYPTCIMHYGAQNGFGGNTTGYAICAYSAEKGEYELLGTCDSLDEDDYDLDDEDDVFDLFICKLVKSYRDGDDTVGSIDLNRLKNILKNDAYSTIKIIE